MKTAIIYYSKHHGNTKKVLDAIRQAVAGKNVNILGEYGCLGFNTYGPFKLIGGIAKNHPDSTDIEKAIAFYNNLYK